MAFLELKDASKSYGVEPERTDVLHNINLSVEEGEFLAIVGFSGSGKTTLISLINGLVSPDTGSIKLKGKRLMALVLTGVSYFRTTLCSRG